ncbi:hypothetical protein [uncultured Salinicola sp.]|uniref:hypothetical protein n=1 Tax=uncultured Salinicola sp. TaxID=1193542 RepID=UPI00260FF021|nr:hypothetical protein [uncultured Salinicola sp.]|tara:strand:- start:178 stop:351 length:174 start_codon:yes stop_codon:yes gene_type:complete
MGIFRSGNSFGAGVLTGDGLGNRRRGKKSSEERPVTGDLDGSFRQGHDHSKRSFQPD